ncbi:MAG: 2'-5' RNA ligase family protein, partial [Leptolyngbya sp. SIO3F4]|nr:2'-5' RNA ligase family protein [Leptolyngbya sp. SIO3F4]
QRFFIALVPPSEVQTSVNAIKHHFKENYGSRKAFNSPPHITLQAPFELPSKTNLDQLTDQLKKFADKRESFEVSLQNFGAFPPKVIYIDVVKSPKLLALWQDLSNFMENTYGLIDRRCYPKFCPHMTVAFRDLTKAAFHKAWPIFKEKPIQINFTANALILLHHNGQHWEIYEQYPMAMTK